MAVSLFFYERVAVSSRQTTVCVWFVLLVSATGNWTLLSKNLGPSPRCGHAAAAGKSRVLWIYGGKDENVLGDVWLFTDAAQAWSTYIVEVYSDIPSPRKEHVLVSDRDGSLWLQGGQDDYQFFNDLWKLAANEWTLVSNASVPSRSGHIGVWDSVRDALWIHGGYHGRTFRPDMWKFDVARGWFSVNDGINKPSARAHHVAVLDDNGAIWIHGGFDGGLRDDLWKFDTSTFIWNLISTGGPSARAHHVGVWDPMNQALWLHGGFDGMARQDLWSFATLTATWSLASESGPSARFDHVAAWDTEMSAVVIHGGCNQGLQGDLWKFQVPVLTTWTTTGAMTSETISTTSVQAAIPNSNATTTSSAKFSLLVALEEATGERSAFDLLPLLLLSIILGLLACCCALYWYKKSQKSREVIVLVPPPPLVPPPVPPPAAPPFPPQPPSPTSPHRVVVVPAPAHPGEPQPMCVFGVIPEAGVIPDQVDVQILKLPALTGHTPTLDTERASHPPWCSKNAQHTGTTVARPHTNDSCEVEFWTQNGTETPSPRRVQIAGAACEVCGKSKIAQHPL